MGDSGRVRRLYPSSRNFTTFFFSNFPVNYGEYDMFKTFQRWARVKEVFISRRLNRWGRILGFVRFFEVRDVRRLEKELDQIYIGKMKLFVNIPKYRRAERAQPVRSTRDGKVDHAHFERSTRIVKSHEGHQANHTGLRSHDAPRKTFFSKNVWRDKKGKDKVEWRVVDSKQNEGKMSYACAVKSSPQDRWKGLSVEFVQQNLPWMEKSMVGHLVAGLAFKKFSKECFKGG